MAGILLAGPAGAVKETDSIRDARDKREAAKGLAAEAAEALEKAQGDADEFVVMEVRLALALLRSPLARESAEKG